MKRTVALKLSVDAAQSAALSELAALFAGACNSIAPAVQEHRCWNRLKLHGHVYYRVRGELPRLGSQMVCQAIHRVADAYKALKSNGGFVNGGDIPAIAFRPSSVNFDKRTYALKSNTLSLYTPDGRIQVPFLCGVHQRSLLAIGVAKEARLTNRKGTWYFNLFLDIPDVDPVTTGSIFGVDVGENNLAATSSGKVFGGGKLRHERDMHLAARRRLQSNGSRASKKKLRAISGQEQRHVKHVNHEISKAIVAEAIRIGASEIRMEDLTHIRKNIKAGKRVRTRLHRWAFRQLQEQIAYKSEGAGLTVVYVNPAYTSQTCSKCGSLGVRKQHSFSCLCGNRAHSDVNASRNIAWFAEPIGIARGVVTRPKFTHRYSRGAVESPAL